MRYDVKKFLFIGVEGDRAEFFKKAQDAGMIHFIDSQPSQPKTLSQEAHNIAQAISILRGLSTVGQEETEPSETAHEMALEIQRLKKKFNVLVEEKRINQLEIARVEPFGDFSLDEVAKIESEGSRKIQFYCAKQGIADQLELSDDILYISSDHGLDYFIAINKQLTHYPHMVEMLIDQPCGALKKRRLEIQKEIRENERCLKSFAKYNNFMHHAYIETLNKQQLEKALGYVAFPLKTNENLFMVEGWVPRHKLENLHELVSHLNIFVEEIALDATDTAPTYLENSGVSRIGEDLVHIYDTPSQTDKDPSLWVLFFFALFFSMIIGDGGYGLIMLLIALYIRYKHSGLKGTKKRALNLLTILAYGCITWGILTTSFFGLTIAPDNPVRKVSFISWLVEKKTAYHIEQQDEVDKEWVKKFPDLKGVTNPEAFLLKASVTNRHGSISYEAYNKFADNVMMELALLVGVLHIIFSMARYVNRNWAQLGWIIFLIGAYLYLPSFLGAASILNYVFGINSQVAAVNGLYLIYLGISLAVILAIIKHKWLGLLEVSVVIQIFGDVLSYLRLYALALAGSLLTATMLDLAAGVPFVFGILILIFGHIVNIVLGIMGGIIHGLRLNFLEWYHYSFEGGGKIFNPLKKQEIE